MYLGDFCWEFWFRLFDAKLVALLCTSAYFLGRGPASYWSFFTSDDRNLPLARLVGRMRMSSWKGAAQSRRIPWEGQWWKKDTRKVLETSSVWKFVEEELFPSSSFLNIDLIVGKWCREMTEDETFLCSSCVLLDPSSLLARPEMPLVNNQGNVCHHFKWWVYSYSALPSSGLDRSFGKV